MNEQDWIVEEEEWVNSDETFEPTIQDADDTPTETKDYDIFEGNEWIKELIH